MSAQLVQIMMLRWLQKTGGKPIALMGGGTTRVGDPSGKDESRKMLTLEQIEANKDGIKQVFAQIPEFRRGPDDAIMPDNAEWLAALNYIDFLRDVGRHFSVNRMLAMDSVKLRLEREQELSFLEFNYMCLQAYDFVELHRRYGCELQMGGSDQWGNIVTGIDLGRRMGTPQLYALTTPLHHHRLGRQDGQDRARRGLARRGMLSPYDYWQYWRNCEDADVGRFLKLFTELPLDEIAASRRWAAPRSTRPRKFSRRSDRAWCMGAKRHRARPRPRGKTFEEGALAESLPTVEIAGAGIRRPASASCPPSSKPDSSLPPAKRDARSRAAASRSTTSTVGDERAVIGAERSSTA